MARRPRVRNGKTTTVTMLAAILRAAGLRAAAVGNIGDPLLSAVLKEDPAYDVLAVEAVSFQLYWSSTLAPAGGALLNLADDHPRLARRLDAYVRAKALIWRGGQDTRAVATPTTRGDQAARGAHRPDGVVHAGESVAGQLGVADGVLVDRAFGDGVELGAGRGRTPAGRSQRGQRARGRRARRGHGVPAEAVRDGLRGYVPGAAPQRAGRHRRRGVLCGRTAKATNPPRRWLSLAAYERIVWVAGGQLKGVDVDDLVRSVAPRLRAAVLLAWTGRRSPPRSGDTRRMCRWSTWRVTDDGVMIEVVESARRLAQPGDTVLLRTRRGFARHVPLIRRSR